MRSLIIFTNTPTPKILEFAEAQKQAGFEVSFQPPSKIHDQELMRGKNLYTGVSCLFAK